MTINRLEWQQLLPNTSDYAEIFTRAYPREPLNIEITQPRLQKSLATFCHQHPMASPFMVIKAVDSRAYLSLIHGAVTRLLPASDQIIGSRYDINNGIVTRSDATDINDNFAATDNCLFEEWLENEQLLGCLRKYENEYSLEPGLVHRGNGGILVLSVRTLLAQPHLWFRLKQIATSHYYQWFSNNESRPLPLSIPPMPLNIKIILVGDRYGLSDLQELEPELIESALYTEFESELSITKSEDVAMWCQYLNAIAYRNQLPEIDSNAYPSLIKIAAREGGDQNRLSLCPQLLSNLLLDAAQYTESKITQDALAQAEQEKIWREGYLADMVQNDIALGQIRIETEGYVVGQINGLSVLEYPGHPRALGEPSRISCVVHLGDGEIMDVERKAELGGNLHAKGVMIMQAFLASELASEQQFPFSGSIVFEQSYGEVDGDSASLAGLCAFISSLSLLPINQQIAVTGSVDQFGNVQTIGGINEKIEGFFDVCNQRKLTGTQGIILPSTNVHHLCLKDEVIVAVKAGQFHLWAIDHVHDALPLLIGLPYIDENKASIITAIQERIVLANGGDRSRLPWPIRWTNWFNRG